MEERYFCTVFAQDQKHLIALSKLDVDVFHPTARANVQQEYTIEGLLTLEEVANLVDNGYRVLMEENASKRSRATEFITSAEDWIEEFSRTHKDFDL